jgi:TonB-linked SusC/RagA family outer membrane protein
VSGAWRISNEAFFRNVKAVNDLKIRGSWGRLGNQNIPLYSYLNGVDINQGYSFNNTTVPGSAVIALSDQNISWETTTVSNIGLDLGLWNGLLGITVDAYNKKTTDILARINVPAQVGNLQGPVTNLYSMSNKGLEITVTHEKALGKYFRYNLGAGIAFNKNKVDFLNGDVQYSGDGSLWAIKEGYPVNSYYLYVAEGIFQSQDEIDKHAFQSNVTAPGDIKYKDLDGNGKIDSDDRIITGRTVPQYTYNFNLGVSYRKFNLTAFFQGVQGIDMYPIYNLSFPLYNGAGLTKDQLENSWTPDHPDARYPRLGEPKRGSGINYKNSTFWLRDASYLRIKNILLSYDIPVYVLDLIHIKKARLFVNAQNYLTFSKYKNTDPERNTFQQDISEYPTVKTITVGVNINF